MMGEAFVSHSTFETFGDQKKHWSSTLFQGSSTPMFCSNDAPGN